MKRMIISPSQLKAINEAASVMYSAPSSNVQSVAQTALAKHPGQEVTIDVTDNTPGTDGTLGFSDTTANTNPSQIKNYDKMTFGSNSNTPNGCLAENRFSKRQVELGRMLEMRKNGKVFSKKQLNEMFMETQDNANRLRQGIGGCRLHDIFAAIEEFFPEEVDGVKEAFMNGADLPEYICSIFSNDDINGEKEQAFLERLGI